MLNKPNMHVMIFRSKMHEIKKVIKWIR